MLRKSLIAGAIGLVAWSAQADTVLGTSFADGSSSYTTTLGGVTANFSAFVGANAGKFDLKAGQGGFQGVGVEGKTAGEIDIGESIQATFGSAIGISGLALGLLFDGPEYSDPHEIAKVSAQIDGIWQTYTLTAIGATSAVWSAPTSFGSVVTNMSPATASGGGAWSVLNPFGGASVTGLSFTAVNACLPGASCPNNSDYTLISVSAVPEPQSYFMMLAGLALMGTIAKRRKNNSS